MKKYKHNGNIYVFLEVDAPEGKWMAISPALGDQKYWGESEEALKESLGIKSDATEASGRHILWECGAVTYYSDGVVDIRTPFARFKASFKGYTRGEKKISPDKFTQYLSGDFEDAFSDLMDELNISYFKMKLEKIRIPGMPDIEIPAKKGKNRDRYDTPSIGAVINDYFNNIPDNPIISTYLDLVEHENSENLLGTREWSWSTYTPTDEEVHNAKVYFALGSALNFLAGQDDAYDYAAGCDDDLGYRMFKEGNQPQDLATKLRRLADAMERSCNRNF